MWHSHDSPTSSLTNHVLFLWITQLDDEPQRNAKNSRTWENQSQPTPKKKTPTTIVAMTVSCNDLTNRYIGLLVTHFAIRDSFLEDLKSWFLISKPIRTDQKPSHKRFSLQQNHLRCFAFHFLTSDVENLKCFSWILSWVGPHDFFFLTCCWTLENDFKYFVFLSLIVFCS